MNAEAPFLILALAAVLVAVIGVAVVIRSFYQKVDQGRALVVSKPGGARKVSFTGALVLPLVERAEEIDISLKTLVIDRRGREGLICHDRIRADATATFFLRVGRSVDDVLRVAESVGCARAGDQATLESLFSARFSGAMKQAAAGIDFTELYVRRGEYRDLVLQAIGSDLNGYELEDLALDYLEQTPIEQLDPQNILDAEGIRKIKAMAAATKKDEG
ncbi:MAG: hypothetical protein KC609_18615 [Myxococcales bacterium]|nr:hypothetical protein [Myxococcales bacterium]